MPADHAFDGEAADWAGVRVLITGATGFIGRRLTKALVSRGARVVGVSRHREELPDGAEHRVCDLTVIDDVRSLIEAAGPDVVYHLASQVSGTRDLEAVVPMLRANLAAAVHVMDASVRCGVTRLILAGSLEEPDASCPIPASPYAAAKGAADAYGAMFRSLYDFDVRTARIFMVYGPGQPLHQLIPHVAASLLRGTSPPVSSGIRPVDWIYIDDVVAGLVALGGRVDLPVQSVDLGSGTLVTVREVCEMIGAEIGAGQAIAFGALPDRRNERIRVADVERTRAMIGWEPRVTLASGIERTVAAIRTSLVSDMDRPASDRER